MGSCFLYETHQITAACFMGCEIVLFITFLGKGGKGGAKWWKTEAERGKEGE